MKENVPIILGLIDPDGYGRHNRIYDPRGTARTLVSYEGGSVHKVVVADEEKK